MAYQGQPNAQNSTQKQVGPGMAKLLAKVPKKKKKLLVNGNL